MSANVQKTSPLKRCHDEFTGDDIVKIDGAELTKGGNQPSSEAAELLPHPSTNVAGQLSPCLSPSLTDGGSSTPAQHLPSPATPSKAETSTLKARSHTVSPSSVAPPTLQPSGTGPPHKRKRLTAGEKKEKDKEEADKKKEKEKEKEEKQRQKAEEKAEKDKEKAAKAAEREEKRKKKEEEDRLKAQQRDEKKQQKEEELRKKQEAEEKKAKSQPSLKSFFGAPRQAKMASPGPSNSPQKTGPVALETKPSVSEYAKMFQPFFVKEHTRMALPATQMDEETREVKSRILDEFISGERTHHHSSFDAVKALELPGRPPRRGCVHHPVRHIMEAAYKQMESTQNGAGEADSIMREAKRKLAKIPVKVIAFSRDVRPPYYGTATYKPSLLTGSDLRVLARRPVGRTLQLDYDYDSEAEWQEEEGEDVDVDDDEEELDDEDDMDGFLDDTDDAGLARRVFANTMEPESTGVCFEGHGTTDVFLLDHKMEYIHELLGSNQPIDPWSTAYWEPEPKRTAPPKSVANPEQSGGMPPPPAPANAFAALSKPVAATAEPAKLVNDEILNDVKRLILANPVLSKVGMVDVIYQQFRDRSSRAEVKNTIELVAEKRKGNSRTKEWGLKPGHELKT